MVKNFPANVGGPGDVGLIPGSGKSPGVGNDNPLQYSCLENSMEREAWWATVHKVTKSWTWLSTHALLAYYQFSSVTQSCLALCDPMNCSTPGLPVHHQLIIMVVNNAMQPSHPLLSPSPPPFNLSQHQDLFQCVSSSHKVTRVLEFQLQHQSFQWIFRTDIL